MSNAKTKPTADEVNAARDVLTRAATADAPAPRAALIALVTMPEFQPVTDALRKAVMLNPADTEASYAFSMLERLRAAHTPA
jgi:hypothetical protein